MLNIQAWTAKEAVYKAAMSEGIDFRKEIQIKRLPKPGPPVPVFKPEDYDLNASQKELTEEFFGEAILGTDNISFKLYSYISDDFLITLAYTDSSARLGKCGKVK